MRIVQSGGQILLDTSRQWPTKYGEISTHHHLRYEFAATKATGRILDAACGCGYGSQILSIGDREVVGVDQSADAIKWAQKHFPGPTYLQGKIEEAPWTGEFETVVSIETIEHIQDPKPVLEGFRKIGKRLIASVPNEEIHPFRAETYRNDEFPHFRHYTPKQLDELLEGCGFKVLERYRQISKSNPLVIPGTDGMFLIYVCE